MPDTADKYRSARLEDLVVVGFHGTTRERAESIVEGGFNEPSKHDWEWLGNGVYFWQDGPYRAQEWAWEWTVERHGGEAAVVGATIKLERAKIIDLIDIEWCDWLKRFYQDYIRHHALHDKPFLRQDPKHPERKVWGRHPLDCLIINEAIIYWRKKGETITAVRAAFEERGPVYPTSAFYERAHVQIAVRDLSVIRKTWVEQYTQ